VGRLVLALFDAATPERVSASDSICTALQVLEHCQDVREDWENGRIYLPADELNAAGVEPADLGRSPAPPALRQVVAVQVGRARQGLAAAPGLVASLGGWARLAIAGFAAGGLATADAFERRAFDSSAGPPRPRRRDLLRHGVRLLVARGSR
jgi:phytoene/squalene synthetase